MPQQVGKDLVLLGPRLLKAVTATVRLLRRTKADVVLGFGGYVSTPAYLAARRLGLPIVIHEQNVLPGLANRLAAQLTSHVYTSFPQTPLPHALCIGLPMGRAITDLDKAALQRGGAAFGFDLHPERPTLLVSGGSQGAMRINTAVAGAWPELLAHGIQVLHVLGPKNLTPGIVRSLDERTGAVYQPVAYVEQMERAYAAADLMLARSGASTVLEAAAVTLPAVFVPYPHGNGEQAGNEKLVANAGGGIMLRPTATARPPWVAEEIPALFAHPDRLSGMRKALAGVARLDAATVLATRVLRGDPLMGLITPVELPSPEELETVHFIAIGGSGMNGIAAMMLAQGIRVSGSDRQDSKYLRSLK